MQNFARLVTLLVRRSLFRRVVLFHFFNCCCCFFESPKQTGGGVGGQEVEGDGSKMIGLLSAAAVGNNAHFFCLPKMRMFCCNRQPSTTHPQMPVAQGESCIVLSAVSQPGWRGGEY